MACPGEEEAWDILSSLDSKEVTTNSEALCDACQSGYTLECFGQDVRVSLTDRTIFSDSSLGQALLNTLADYSWLSILRYLIHARDVPLSGKLVSPTELPGGGLFAKGTHVLPLKRLATSFARHPCDFAAAARSLGGSPLEYGDMSFQLSPFPRVPVALIVWSGDEDFPPNASLLFDSSCKAQLPIDILWSTAMMVIELTLIHTAAESQA